MPPICQSVLIALTEYGMQKVWSSKKIPSEHKALTNSAAQLRCLVVERLAGGPLTLGFGLIGAVPLL
jgi:hypothetical protein